MMSAAQQHRALGACAESYEGQIVVQVGRDLTRMTPREARTFIRCLMRAVIRAEVRGFELELAGLELQGAEATP